MLTKFLYANVIAKRTMVIITINHIPDIGKMVYPLGDIVKTMYNVLNPICSPRTAYGWDSVP